MAGRELLLDAPPLAGGLAGAPSRIFLFLAQPRPRMDRREYLSAGLLERVQRSGIALARERWRWLHLSNLTPCASRACKARSGGDFDV